MAKVTIFGKKPYGIRGKLKDCVDMNGEIRITHTNRTPRNTYAHWVKTYGLDSIMIETDAPDLCLRGYTIVREEDTNGPN